MKILYYTMMFIGSIVLLLSTFSFVFPFEESTLESLHKLAKWVLYGFIAEFLYGLIRAPKKLEYTKQEWISLLAILVSLVADSLSGVVGAAKLTKMGLLLKSLKGTKVFKMLKSVKIFKTLKLGKKVRKSIKEEISH